MTTNLPPPLIVPLGHRNQCPTALKALAARVPFDALHADVVAVAPWEVPNWEASFTHMGPHMGRCPPQDRSRWVDELFERTTHPGTVIVTVAATVSSQGWFDNLMVGGAGATLTQWVDGSRRTFTNSWCFGTGVVQFDVECFALAKAAEWTHRQFFDHRWPRPSHVYFLMGSLSALTSLPNIRGLQNQREHLLFHSSLTSLVSAFPEVCITTVWSPLARDRVMDSTARFKALQACRITPRASLNRVQSAAYCKSQARARAFQQWAAEWTAKRRSQPWPSFAYEHAVLQPPGGNNHPLWREAVKTVVDPDTGKQLPVYSHHTTTTALRLAIGHAFTAEYSRWFRPDTPPDQLACHCGWPDHLFTHILYECPRGFLFRHRNRPPLHRAWEDLPPHAFFTEEPALLLGYLQTTRLAFKPLRDHTVPFDPG